MWIQTLVVWLVVAACAAYVARTLANKLRPAADGCAGCGGCDKSSPKPSPKACAQPLVFHPLKRPNL